MGDGEKGHPAGIEQAFEKNEWVDQICVVGPGVDQPIMLCVVSGHGKSIPRSEFEERFLAQISDLNQSLKNFQKIGRAIMVKDPWTIENNLLTPTLKLRRNLIHQKYQMHYPDWEASKAVIIWE